MELPVLVEPLASGFRASMQSPMPMSADGVTEDAAVAALGAIIMERLKAGGQLRTVRIPDLDRLRELGDSLVNNPFYDDWLQGIEEYRKIHNAVPEAE